MCMQDQAIGRRLTYRQTAVEFADGGSTPLPRDPRRTRIAVSVSGGSVGISTTSPVHDTGVIAYLTGTTVPTSSLLRLEDYGQLVTGDLTVFHVVGTDVNVVVTEIIAEAGLDAAIQREPI